MNLIYGIILSGGSGKRMGGELPKQFIKLNGESIIRHTLKRFKEWGLFYSVVIVAPPEFISKTEDELSDLLDDKDRIVEGGFTRHESTLKGIASIHPNGDLIVLHDAARPLITSKDLDEVTNGALEFGACTLAEKVNETLVMAGSNTVSSIIDRNFAYTVKTPQAFHSSILDSLLGHSCMEEPTDLTSWLLQINLKSAIKISNPYNIKITEPMDLKKAEIYLSLLNGN